jgi:hypothetical protein
VPATNAGVPEVLRVVKVIGLVVPGAVIKVVPPSVEYLYEVIADPPAVVGAVKVKVN